MSKRSVAILLVLLGISLIHYSNSIAHELVDCEGKPRVSFETYWLRASKTKIAAPALASHEGLRTHLNAKLKSQPDFLARLLAKLDELKPAEGWLAPQGQPDTISAFELPSGCKVVASALLLGSEARAYGALSAEEKRAAELRLALQALDPARRELPARDLALVLLSDRANADKVAAAVQKFESAGQLDTDFRNQPHALLGDFVPSSEQQSKSCPKEIRIDHDGARGLLAEIVHADGTMHVRFEAEATEREIDGVTVKTSLSPNSAYAERAVGTAQEEKITLEYNGQYGEVSLKMPKSRFAVPAMACWYRRGVAGESQ